MYYIMCTLSFLKIRTYLSIIYCVHLFVLLGRKCSHVKCNKSNFGKHTKKFMHIVEPFFFLTTNFRNEKHEDLSHVMTLIGQSSLSVTDDAPLIFFSFVF